MRGKSADPLNDYFVVTTKHGQPPAWDWEIQTRSRPLGVKLSGASFTWEAKLAGEQILTSFLHRLAQKEQ
jgi:hypothetical protein